MTKEQKVLQKAIVDVLGYFAHFSYAPSFDQIYTFLTVKTTRRALKSMLQHMARENAIVSRKVENWPLNIGYSMIYTLIYTLPPHRIFFKKRTDRAVISKSKIAKSDRFISCISLFPQIKLAGLSGSIALLHADKSDDIDLFVITAPYRLWTTRFICVIIASLMGLRRKRGQQNGPNKLCLNLFFDGADLSVPVQKRNLYVAHEILQMHPVAIRGRASQKISNLKSQISNLHGQDIYDQFLKANEWVFEYFPNGRALLSLRTPPEVGRSNLGGRRLSRHSFHSLLAMTCTIADVMFGGLIEALLKKLQLYFINRHKTTELITDTQLWFFPRDYERVLRQKGILRNSSTASKYRR